MREETVRMECDMLVLTNSLLLSTQSLFQYHVNNHICPSNCITHCFLGCPFYKPNAAIGVARSLHGIIDIEDLKDICTKKKICPYIVAREMMQFSAIIFCPYNYIIYPSIRRAMSIKLDHSVILFDEAHNILQTARDAASIELKLFDFRMMVDAYEALVTDLEKSATYRGKLVAAFASVPFPSLRYVKHRASSILQWMYTACGSLQNHREDRHFTLEYGQRMIAMIQQWICKDGEEMEELQTHVSEIMVWNEELIQEDMANERRGKVSKVIARHENGLMVLDVIRSITDVLEYLYMMNERYVADFRLLIEKKIHPKGHQHRGYQEIKEEGEKNTVFSLICLNAGIVFNQIKSKVSSLILASGKLSVSIIPIPFILIQ